MRLIDADALYEKAADWEAQALHIVETTMHDEDDTKWRRWSIILTERTAFKYDVADAPTIEQPEIIRCKDCKYYLNSKEKCGLVDVRLHFYETSKVWTEDSFCSWGEKNDFDEI